MWLERNWMSSDGSHLAGPELLSSDHGDRAVTEHEAGDTQPKSTAHRGHGRKRHPKNLLEAKDVARPT